MKTLATSWFRYLALAMAACVLIGVPLMLLLRDPGGVVLLTAAVVFPAVGLMAAMLRLLESTSIPRPLIVVGTALVVGVVAGVLIFWPGSFGPLGLLVCVPIALVAAGVGLIMEWIMIKVPQLALLAVIVGGTLLLSSLVALIVVGV